MTDTPCPWCREPFEPVKRGPHFKRFCSAECKNRFNAAARSYTYRMVAAGLLSVGELRRVAASYTTHEGPRRDSG